MKLLTLAVLALLFTSCGTEETATLLQKDHRVFLQSEEIPQKEKQAAIEALSVIFKEPSSGVGQTKGYKAYLDYKRETMVLGKLMIDSLANQNFDVLQKIGGFVDDLEERRKAEDPENMVDGAVTTLAQTYQYFKDDMATEEKLKKRDLKIYNQWQTERKAIIKDRDQAKDDNYKNYHNELLNQLDQRYQFKFMGFLLGVE